MELKDLEEMFKMEQELDIPHRDRWYNQDFDKRELEADKVNELEKRVEKLEKVVAQLVARETNKQREFETNEEFERLRDEASSQIGHDM
ncbi:MAG: hypothetical protein WC910_10640 [Bacteroidales bacterium]